MEEMKQPIGISKDRGNSVVNYGVNTSMQYQKQRIGSDGSIADPQVLKDLVKVKWVPKI